MKLNHLRDVLAVAEHGSLRAAGRHLDIPQPLISRSIREIEHELGASLFERHARGVRLTDIGKAFLHRAVIVNTELQRAREEVEQLKGRMTGQVSVGLSAASLIAILPNVLPGFRKRYPDAVLKVTEGLLQTVEKDISEGSVDFYIGPYEQAVASPQYHVERLFENDRVIVARRGHPLTAAKSLGDLADAYWIRPTLSAQSTEADFEAFLRDNGIAKPRVVMHTRSALATLIAVTRSDLLSILPQQWLEFGPTSQSVSAIHVTGPMAAAPVCIIRRRDVPLTPIAEYLADLSRRAGLAYGRRNRRAAGSRGS